MNRFVFVWKNARIFLFKNVEYLVHECNRNVREEINLESRKLQLMVATKRRQVSTEFFRLLIKQNMLFLIST